MFCIGRARRRGTQGACTRANRENRAREKAKNDLQIDLYDDLAGILSIAQEKKDMGELKRFHLLSANDNKLKALTN